MAQPPPAVPVGPPALAGPAQPAPPAWLHNQLAPAFHSSNNLLAYAHDILGFPNDMAEAAEARVYARFLRYKQVADEHMNYVAEIVRVKLHRPAEDRTVPTGNPPTQQ